MKVTNRKGEELEVFGDIYKAPFKSNGYSIMDDRGNEICIKDILVKVHEYDIDQRRKMSNHLMYIICDSFNQQFEKKQEDKTIDTVGNCANCNVESPETDTIKKPPIGIMPKYLHDEKRFKQLLDAIGRYCQVGMVIPVEWISEYNELLTNAKETENE